MKGRLALIALLTALAAAPASAAEVYRCVTAGGTVRYSDKPCKDGKAEKLAIRSAPTNRDAVQEQIESRKEQIQALEESEAEAAKAEAQRQAEAEQQRQQCRDARERLEKLTSARRVTTGEGENRRFLEDAEMIERRQQAQDRVNELCGND